MEKQQYTCICADGPGSINNCPYVICRKKWGIFPHTVTFVSVDQNNHVVTRQPKKCLDFSRWECYCTKSGKEVCVGFVEPYIPCEAPNGCMENPIKDC